MQADELISHTYHNIYGMSLTGLRFFTVYGPWGRPDMAAFKFAKNIMMGANITVFQVDHVLQPLPGTLLFTTIPIIIRTVVY